MLASGTRAALLAGMYTEISFWRAGALSQMVEIDISSRHNPARYVRVWLARMTSLEPDSAYVVRVRTGSEVAR